MSFNLNRLLDEFAAESYREEIYRVGPATTCSVCKCELAHDRKALMAKHRNGMAVCHECQKVKARTKAKAWSTSGADTYTARRQAGLCWCGQEAPVEGRTSCANCLVKKRERARQRRLRVATK